jgi:N-acetylated-alpha-linked acidic dipeptidase
VPPPHEDVPPILNFAPLDNAADTLTQSAERYRAAIKRAWPAGLSAATLADLNQKLMESERRLTTPEGLLRRSWYRHMIYAPGVYSGYGVKTLPGIREAIEEKRWAEADSEILRVAAVLNNESALINAAAAEVEQAAR